MPIALVAVAKQHVTPDPSGSVTVGKPAGTASGDVLVAQVSITWGEPSVITLPEGWTELRNDVQSTDYRQVIAYKVAGGSEPASYEFTFSSVYTSGMAAIAAYRGADSGAPVNAHSGQAYLSDSTPDAPSVTTDKANCMLVAICGGYEDASFTPPAGMTERWDFGYDQTPPTDYYAGTMADALQVAAGASGDKTFTCSTVNRGVAALVALAPMAAGAARQAAAFVTMILRRHRA